MSKTWTNQAHIPWGLLNKVGVYSWCSEFKELQDAKKCKFIGTNSERNSKDANSLEQIRAFKISLRLKPYGSTTRLATIDVRSPRLARCNLDKWSAHPWGPPNPSVHSRIASKSFQKFNQTSTHECTRNYYKVKRGRIQTSSSFIETCNLHSGKRVSGIRPNLECVKPLKY